MKKLRRLCGLSSPSTADDFHSNNRQAKEIAATCITREEELRRRRDDLVSELRKNENDLKLEEEELASLRARKTQIPGQFISFRAQLCADLEIGEDELPFAGELLQVNEAESIWEGAIEKLLRDTGISLLVPKTHYRSVSKYVNDNSGQRVG